MLEVQTVAF